MKTLLLITAAVGSLALGTAPALAHHSANAQFNTSVENSVTGVLVELRDINPHSQWKATITNAAGQAEEWSFEGVSPSALRARGVKVKEDINVGETYTFIYAPARNGTKSGLLTAMVIKGKRVQYVSI